MAMYVADRGDDVTCVCLELCILFAQRTADGQSEARPPQSNPCVYLSFAMSAVDPWGDFEVKSSFLRLYFV